MPIAPNFTLTPGPNSLTLAWTVPVDPNVLPGYVSGYEVFQFCLGHSPAESIQFSVFESDLGDGGFESSTLYGPDTGRKRWKIGYPVMSGASADLKVLSSNGQLMTAADYLWDLYCRKRVSGQPFVIRSPKNGQYYLVKFANPNLEYNRFVTQLYATQLELKQMRTDVSVFDVTRLPKQPFGFYRPQDLDTGSGTLPDYLGSGHDLAIVGGVTTGGDTQNSLGTSRLNGTSGYLEYASAITLADVLIVAKYRGDTFSNNAGLLANDAGSWLGLIGENGETTFADQSFDATIFTYRLAGNEMDQDDQEAPMNEFALVHARWETPVSLANLRIGKKGGTAGTFGAWDLGDILLFDEVNTLTDIRELAESEMTIWDL